MNKTEILNEAKKAKSLEKLKQMAADAGIPLTEEEAKFYFSLVNQQEGELSLEELDAATGGADTSVTPDLSNCRNWQCNRCNKKVGCTCNEWTVCKHCVHYIPSVQRSECPFHDFHGVCR